MTFCAFLTGKMLKISQKMDALRFYVGARSGVDQIIGNATVGFATVSSQAIHLL